MRIFTSLAAVLLLATVFAANSAQAQANASTGVIPYGTAGSYLDDFYFDVDVGSTTVNNLVLSMGLTSTDLISIGVEFYVIDEITSLPLFADYPSYNFAVNVGYTSGSPTPVGPVNIASTPIWGPGALVPGNFPLTGTVRFMVHVTVDAASTFPNDVSLTFSTSIGSNVSTANYPFTIGTNMGVHLWDQVAPGNTGLLAGYDRVSDSDYFQRNHSNMSWGAARFGNTTDELMYYIDVDLGTATVPLDVALVGSAYLQQGAATGNCIFELFHLGEGFDDPVISVTADATNSGFLNGGYGTHTLPAVTGLVRFRLVVRGQNLQNVSYGATTTADFRWEFYFNHEANAQAMINQPTLAPPRMAITPAGSTLTTSPTTLTCTGGSGSPTSYNWAIQGTAPTGVSLSSATGASTDLTFGATTPANATVTVRATNGTTGEFAEETYTLNFGGGGGGPTTLDITGPASLPNGTQGSAYGPVTVTATGGTTPYNWSATGLPAGVTINATTGEISGNPSATGTFNVTVTVTDSSSPQQTDTQNYTFDVVAAGTLIITTGQNLPGGTVGQAYSTNITAANGTGAHTWSVSTGTLPPGIALGSSSTNTVALSGSPTTAGTYNFTIQVTDSSTPAQNDTQAFTIVIAAGTGGGGGGLGGGGGGGGGCAVDVGGSHWVALLGMLALLGIAGTLRLRKE